MVGGREYPLTRDEEDIVNYFNTLEEVIGTRGELITMVSAKLGIPEVIAESSIDHLVKIGRLNKPTTYSPISSFVEGTNTMYYVSVDDYLFGPMFDYGGDRVTKIEFLSSGIPYISLKQDHEIPAGNTLILKYTAKIPKWDFFTEAGIFRRYYKKMSSPLIRVSELAIHYGDHIVKLPINHVVDLSPNAKDTLTYQIKLMRVEEDE